MAGFEDLIKPNVNQLNADDGQSYKFIDADTLQDSEGNNLRLAGVNAPEIFHEGAGAGASTQVGSAETTTQTAKLANELGFTKLVRSGEEGKFGRGIVDLVNPKTGESFSRKLASEGVQPIHHKYDDGHSLLKSREFAAAKKTGAKTAGTYEDTEWDKARMMIEQATQDEMKRDQQFKRAQAYSGEIGQLQTFLNETEDPAQRAAIQRQINSINSSASADIRYNDRNQVTGAANDPMSASWDQGLIGVTEASYGILELLGEKLGSQALEDIGEAGITRARSRLADFGTTIVDYKDVKGFGDAVEYLGNNLALSLPYMAISVGGAVAAPFTAGLSLAAPAAVYAGQTWNEMEGEAHEKNASIAIASGTAQAALDKLGLGFIFKKGVGSTELLNKAVKELSKTMPKELAEETVANATRKELAGFAGDAIKTAKSQLQAKAIFKDLSKRALVGGVGEAGTEALQETTAYLGAVLGSKKEFNWEELNHRMISAAIAGGTLGGGLSAPGAAYNTGAWADVANRILPASEKAASEAEKHHAAEKAEFGYVASTEEVAADAAVRAKDAPPVLITDRTANHKAAQTKRTALDKFTEEALNVSQLWQGSTRNILTKAIQERSLAGRKLADMFGGNLQKIRSGATFENSKTHRVAIYKNYMPEPQAFWKALTGKERIKASRRGEVSDATYSILRTAVNKEGDFDPKLIPENTPNRQDIIETGKRLIALGDKMYVDQKKHNPELGYVKNYLFNYKSLSKAAVAKNKVGFQNALVSKFKYSNAEAKALVDEIINNSEVNDLDEAFSVVRGGISPQAHKSRSLALSEQAEFKEFFEKDLFANVSNASKSAARYTAHRDFIGENGAVVSKLLDDMQAEGIPKAEVDKIASQLQDYLDAESGNYKRPTSDIGKSAQKLQRNFMMFTTMASLPLATISSFVEYALVHKGLTKDQIFGGKGPGGKETKGSLKSSGTAMADLLWSKADATITPLDEKKIDFYNANPNELVRELGYYDWDVGAATVTGATEINPVQQQAYEAFFRYTGLTGWTNFTRAARASIGADYMLDKAKLIKDQRNSDSVRTREVQEAEEALRNLGIDVDQYVEMTAKMESGIPFTPEEDKFMEDTTREALFNFTNDAVALPQAANRPLIYQDPRFALFTQFQGFIATFTANHIPKLWGEYVKRGTPAMKYNAFATMTTMIMLGFASQALKDLIKYGGKTPHLDDAEYVQRGIRGSGLLGTSERVLDQFFPIYEQKTDGVGDWVFKTGAGESPAASYLGKLGKSAGKFIEGDAQQGIYYGLKSAPVIGPATDVNKWLSHGLSGGGWNFKGDN